MDEERLLNIIRPMIRGLKQDQLYDTDERVENILEIIDKRLHYIGE